MLRIFPLLVLLMVLALRLRAVGVSLHHPAAAALAFRTMSACLLMRSMLVRSTGGLGLRLAPWLRTGRLVLAILLWRLGRCDSGGQEECEGDKCSSSFHVTHSQFRRHRGFFPLSGECGFLSTGEGRGRGA